MLSFRSVPSPTPSYHSLIHTTLPKLSSTVLELQLSYPLTPIVYIALFTKGSLLQLPLLTVSSTVHSFYPSPSSNPSFLITFSQHPFFYSLLTLGFSYLCASEPATL